MEIHVVKCLLFGLAARLTGGCLTAFGAGLGFTSFRAVWPILTIYTITCAIVHNAKQSVTSLVGNRAHTLRNRIEQIRRNIDDIHGLVRLGPYLGKATLLWRLAPGKPRT